MRIFFAIIFCLSWYGSAIACSCSVVSNKTSDYLAGSETVIFLGVRETSINLNSESDTFEAAISQRAEFYVKKTYSDHELGGTAIVYAPPCGEVYGNVESIIVGELNEGGNIRTLACGPSQFQLRAFFDEGVDLTNERICLSPMSLAVSNSNFTGIWKPDFPLECLSWLGYFPGIMNESQELRDLYGEFLNRND